MRLSDVDIGRLLGLKYFNLDLKQLINLYFNPDSLLVSTSDNLTRTPPPLFPFFSLVALANTLASLRLQLMKATMLAESSTYFIFSPGSLHSRDVYRRESGRRCTCSFFLTFLSLNFENVT